MSPAAPPGTGGVRPGTRGESRAHDVAGNGPRACTSLYGGIRTKVSPVELAGHSRTRLRPAGRVLELLRLELGQVVGDQALAHFFHRHALGLEGVMPLGAETRQRALAQLLRAHGGDVDVQKTARRRIYRLGRT